MFHRFDLRTTELAAARAFYEDVLQRPLAPGLSIVPLPEVARARGAPAHWLGHVVAADPGATRDRFVALGAEVRGPALRDPFGAMIAIDPAPATPTDAVVWHQRSTREPEKAWAAYAELFGWRDAGVREVVGGHYRTFAWREGGAPVGGIYDITGSPQAHEAWLFYFAVDDLDAALARARAHGARYVSAPFDLGDGRRAAYLDDAQGAAFGLVV